MQEGNSQALWISKDPITETDLIGSVVGDSGGDSERLPDENRAVSKRETHHQVIEEGFR